MIKTNQRFLNAINCLSDFALSLLSLIISYSLKFYAFGQPEASQPLTAYLSIGVINGMVCVALYAILRLYEPKRRTSYLHDFSIVLRADIIDILILGIVLYLRRFVDFSRLLLFFFFVVNTLLIAGKHVIVRLTLRAIRQQGYNIKHILLIGDGALAAGYARNIEDNSRLGYHIVGAVVSPTGNPRHHLKPNMPILGTIAELPLLLSNTKRFDEAVIAFDENYSDNVKIAIDACNRHGLRFSIIPSFTRYIFSAARPTVETIGDIQIFDFCASPLDYPLNKFVKRAMDVAASFLGLVITSPLFLIAAIGTKLSSPGPVFFKQKRVGLKKETFNMIKFRSMRVNAEQDTAWSAKGDPRKTRFGQFIRKTSIDELPQLINVLRGDMSLIGPRPEIPFHVDHFKDEIPYYMARHQIRPGMTGWAQVNGLRGDTSISERVKYDLYYIYNWSILFDIQILFKTVFGGLISKAE